MRQLLCLGALLSSLCLFQPVFGKGPTYQTLEEARTDPDFEKQGEYVGSERGVQVIALGKGQFNAVTYQGGLPGAGWDKSPTTSKEGTWEEIQSALEGLKKTERKSPTLGKKAPEGAVVLFDGTKETFEENWKAGEDKFENGLLVQGVSTKPTFGDMKLHLEFLLPYMPEARGQARGNSGCYLQGRYEIQMLDSFGLKGLDNECGGIYKAAAPDVNMCLPPLTWQTYDVDFTTAKFDDSGKKVSNAKVTVKHNGVVIHQDLEIPEHTPGGVVKAESKETGPIFLQDHSNPVRYRNIWVVTK
ncbi:MAG TPA: DUF1080 domain-containing protein [Planctomicrobium sp.]|nr:DUF1080 domain-containing protein [Planctomicrobium sp.]